MAKSLYSTVLHNYTYEQVRDLCFTEGSNFANVFDCDWGVWRDKAVADFDISPEFFDLVRSFASNGIRTLSGSQRYLQIASYIKLTPLSGVRLYKDIGVIEGVYEAFAGYNEAIKRKDVGMIWWFYHRLKPEQKRGLRLKSTTEKQLTQMERLQRKWEKEARDKEKRIANEHQSGLSHLARVVRTGKIDAVDKLIHSYFILPKPFNIEKDIPRVPFWEYLGGNDALYELPLQTNDDEEVNIIMKAAIRSANTRIVDFFRSIFRDRNLGRFTKYVSEKSLLMHKRPEEDYGIALRFLDSQTGYMQYEYMVELLLSLPETEITLNSVYYIITKNMGNITYLQTFLPFVDPKDMVSYYYGDSPLSRFVVEEYRNV